MKIAHLHVADKKNKGDFGIVQAAQELIKKNVPNCKIQDFPVDLLRDGANPRVLKQINSSDIIVIGGGGIIYHWFLPYKHSFINQLQKPIVIYGVGYINELGAPALPQKSIKSVVFLINKASLVGVRDINTKKWLIKNGAAVNKIQLIGDPAILLSEIKPKNTIKLGKLNIGLNLNYSGWLGFGKYQDKILSNYNQIIEYFDSLGAQIHYLQHHPDEKRIYTKLKTTKLSIINKPPREQKYLYGRMDMIVGMMLHSAVMSFGAGTPAINLGYDLRNKSFAEYIGLPDLHLSCSQLTTDNLFKLTKKVWQRKDNYKKKILTKRKEILVDQTKFLKQLKELK